MLLSRVTRWVSSMSHGNLTRTFFLFLLLYALFYLLTITLDAHTFLGRFLTSVFDLQEADGVLYCGGIGWKAAPECTGIFALSLWLALAITWRLPLRYTALGAIFAYLSDLLRVFLSIYLGCVFQSSLPHVLLWFLPPTIILIVWRYFYSRRSPVV